MNDVNNASKYTFLGNPQTFSTISKKTANGRYTLLETPPNATRTIEVTCARPRWFSRVNLKAYQVGHQVLSFL